jgi:hypothetical protein
MFARKITENFTKIFFLNYFLLVQEKLFQKTENLRRYARGKLRKRGGTFAGKIIEN